MRTILLVLVNVGAAFIVAFSEKPRAVMMAEGFLVLDALATAERKRRARAAPPPPRDLN